MRATGTDDVPEHVQRLVQRTAHERVQTDETARERDADAREVGGERKLLQIADVSDDVQSDATLSKSTPGRTRTCDLRIRNPPLYPTELRGRRQWGHR